MHYKNIELDRFQEEAIEAIGDGLSLIISAPTGAGKTLVAEYAIEKCINEGSRIIYTAPIKALSNQKFRDFSAQYGDKIGIKTGDVTINPTAQVLLMTTEVFRNTIFDNTTALDNIRYAIFDEIHYLDDIERGTVWEESIIFAPKHIKIICLSATVPNIHKLAKWMRRVRSDNVKVIETLDRPIPLKHLLYLPAKGVRMLKEMTKQQADFDAPSHPPHNWRGKLISHLYEENRLPAIYFAFNRRLCEEYATHVNQTLLSDSEKTDLLRRYDSLCEKFNIDDNATSRQLRNTLAKGIAYHHAGLLPTLKEVIERLFTSGLLKLIFATETFAVGINMPARTVVFDTLRKFDGRQEYYIKTREYHQMAGRAGRRGIDPIGYVYSVVQPEMNYKNINRTINGDIEPIRSQFNLSYSAVLTLYSRLGEDKLFQACEKSFSNVERRRRSKQHSYFDKLTQLKRRLTFLRQFGYIADRNSQTKLTEKGSFASTVYGYEVQVAELYFSGLMDNLSEDELSVLFAAIVFEPKKSDWYRKLDHLKWLGRETEKILRDIRTNERLLAISDITKDADFKLASAVYAWSRGCDFRDLEKYTTAADGDIVRYLRLAIQLIRQTTYALKDNEPLRHRLINCIKKLSRDEIDAEKQLRMEV